MSIVEKSAYTDAQLYGYDRYRDIIMRERTLVVSSHREGFEEGLAKGIEEEKIGIARTMKADGLSVETIAKYTGLSAEEIAAL